MLPTRWLDQSFAVVEVADYPDLTVYVENQPIGYRRKGARAARSPAALRHQPGELDPAELPLDASISNPTVLLTPAPQWAVVRFPITRATAATMRLVQERQPVPVRRAVHAPGEATVALDGLIFLRMLGLQRSFRKLAGHRCRFSFQRPEDGIRCRISASCCRATEPATARLSGRETDSLSGIALAQPESRGAA